MFKWGRYSDGYEISSQGDKRFSAFYARLLDGESIEYKYQVRVKGYSSIKEGKGKPPIDKDTDTWEEYLKLWEQWSAENPKLIEELFKNVSKCNYTLTDKFAKTKVNQARALCQILNNMELKRFR